MRVPTLGCKLKKGHNWKKDKKRKKIFICSCCIDSKFEVNVSSNHRDITKCSTFCMKTMTQKTTAQHAGAKAWQWGRKGGIILKTKMHFELSPLILWIALWIVNTYSEFQVNIFSNNRYYKMSRVFACHYSKR